MSEEPFVTPYPDYDVLAKYDGPSWNEATRKVVDARLNRVPPRRFFGEADYALLRAIIDTLLPQPERDEKDRIPVEAFIDAMLHDNQTAGTRYADQLPMRESWRRGLGAIDYESRLMHGRPFLDISEAERHDLFNSIDQGSVAGKTWSGLHPRRFFRHVLLKEAVKVYYAHPRAWNEIGFGGPAAPRGYVRLGPDDRDPWEAKEMRAPQKVDELP